MIKIYAGVSFFLAGSAFTMAILAHSLACFGGGALNLFFGLIYMAALHEKPRVEEKPKDA